MSEIKAISDDVVGILSKRYGKLISPDNIADGCELIIHTAVAMVFCSVGLTPKDSVPAGVSTVKHLGEQVKEALKRSAEKN